MERSINKRINKLFARNLLDEIFSNKNKLENLESPAKKRKVNNIIKKLTIDINNVNELPAANNIKFVYISFNTFTESKIYLITKWLYATDRLDNIIITNYKHKIKHIAPLLNSIDADTITLNRINKPMYLSRFVKNLPKDTIALTIKNTKLRPTLEEDLDNINMMMCNDYIKSKNIKLITYNRLTYNDGIELYGGIPTLNIIQFIDCKIMLSKLNELCKTTIRYIVIDKSIIINDAIQNNMPQFRGEILFLSPRLYKKYQFKNCKYATIGSNNDLINL